MMPKLIFNCVMAILFLIKFLNYVVSFKHERSVNYTQQSLFSHGNHNAPDVLHHTHANIHNSEGSLH